MIKTLPARVDLQFKGPDSTFNFIFWLMHPITTVLGDSGSGKTYLCNFIKELQKGTPLPEFFNSTIPLSDIVVIDNTVSLNAMASINHKLIIIDNFNRLLNQLNESDKKAVIKFINTSCNTFILMYRGADSEGLNVSIQSISELWVDTEICKETGHKTFYIEISKSHDYIESKSDILKDWNN